MGAKEIKPPKNQKEYDKAAIELRLSYAPATKSCRNCGWPVIKGCCCGTCGTSDPDSGNAVWFE